MKWWKPKNKDARLYLASIVVIATAFTIYFLVAIIPQLLVDRDIIGAFAAGFVNPYSTGYSLDVIACWLFLLAWVLHERHVLNVQNGWIALILGVVPGVVVGLVAYAIIRHRQVQIWPASDPPQN